MTMDLRSDRLKVLVAVVDAGGFSRGARALALTQSTVSQAIAALEADVGEPLFVRAGREVQLTEAGRVLDEHAREVLRSVESAREAVRALRQVASGTLALGASDTLSTHLLPPVFAAFRARYPGIALQLDNRPSPAIAARVAARQLDVGVVSLPLPSSLSPSVLSLKQVPLVHQRDVVVMPKGHPLARRSRVRLQDVAAYPLLLLDRTTGLRTWLEARFAAAKVTPRVTMEMSSVEVIKRLVELDFGLSIIPALAVDARDALVAVPLSGLEDRRQVGLVLGPAPSRATRAFVEVARSVLRGE
jgi:DNA-binding transcriptional LysR family regulator